jgi:hypothetical protein
MTDNHCPVCQTLLTNNVDAPHTRTYFIKCPRCGEYRLTFEAASVLRQEFERHGLRWAITSHAIRRMFVEGNEPHLVNQAWLQSVWANEVLPRPQEQADIFLQYLGVAEVAPGDWVRCSPQHLGGILGTADKPEHKEIEKFFYVVERLRSKKLVEQIPLPDSDGMISFRLSFDGWERFEELRRGSGDSRVAFMAMGYGNPQVDRAYSSFVGAVHQTGFVLRRLDQKPKAGLIDLRMRVEIRSAKFLVADLTDENRGAYWEAGFAEGLTKKVYYTCEAAKFEQVKTHFDTEHLFTIKWAAANMVEALDELKAAIRNDFPADARQTDR